MSPPDTLLPSASPATDDPGEDRAEICVRVSAIPDRSEWRLRMLEATAEAGLEILQEIRRRAVARDAVEPVAYETLLPPAAPEGDLGLLCSRIQRAIRQTVALHGRLEEEFRVRERETEAEAAARMAAQANRAAAAEARRRANHQAWQERTVRNAVHRAIDMEDTRHHDLGDLHEDLYERIENFDDYVGDGNRPVGEIVEEICKAMGLTFDPVLWQDEPWALDEIQAKPAGSPYADWPDPDGDELDELGLAEVSSAGTGPP